MPLNGNAVEQKGDESTIEISVGENTMHQLHIIFYPTKIAFLCDDKNIVGIVAINKTTGTKKLIHIIEPMPVIISHS